MIDDFVKTETLGLLERMVAIPSVSEQSNLAVVDLLAERLKAAGATISLTYNSDGRKANLLAALGPLDRAGIVFSGHTDVVPVDGQVWTTDPFALTRIDSRLYGRGTTDMKAFVALATVLAPKLSATLPGKPIILAFSYDEELGCLGVPSLVDDLKSFAAPPLGCIVGEPTEMRIVTAQKGKIGCHVEVFGQAAHSALSHNGANAVEAAAKAMHHLFLTKEQLRTQGPFNPFFQAPDFTTVEICKVSGGIAVNVIPDQCSFDFDVRALPGVDPGSILLDLRKWVEKYASASTQSSGRIRFEFTEVPGCIGFQQDVGHSFVKVVQAHLAPHDLSAVPYGTDAGHFSQAGIPTVICGPGNMANAHQSDEFIELDQLDLCMSFMIQLAAGFKH